MFDVITAISTNLFRTCILKKFMHVFFQEEVENKKKENLLYVLFFTATLVIYLLFHFPPANIITNILMMYLVTQMYEGEQKKKILVVILVYSINMSCDVFAVYSFSNYIVGEDYNELAVYVTILLFSICEFLVERFIITKRKMTFTPPHWSVLILIPVISIALLFFLLMSNLNNRMVLVVISAGILLINMLIFYLYHALADTYLKLEETALFERQLASYSNQLDVLMQSEEKVTALRHDMKNHLNELQMMAERDNKQEIVTYIQNMQMYMENKNEYSNSGNKEIDSLLNYMLNKAQEVLDKVECKINIPKGIEINPFDFNIIFGNLLDNAILAATHANDKWLSVLIRYEKGMLFIDVKNSYDGNLQKRKNNYLTTKQEKENHGIGLQNVKRVVSNYHGKMKIFDQNNIFEVEIMLYAQ